MSEISDTTYGLIKAGVLNAVSVGLRLLDFSPLPSGGIRINRCELVEFSIVAVPANPEALIIQRASATAANRHREVAAANALVASLGSGSAGGDAGRRQREADTAIALAIVESLTRGRPIRRAAEH